MPISYQRTSVMKEQTEEDQNTPADHNCEHETILKMLQLIEEYQEETIEQPLSIIEEKPIECSNEEDHTAVKETKIKHFNGYGIRLTILLLKENTGRTSHILSSFD